MKKLMITIGICTASLLSVAQQDAQFSQYMFNGIYINPAYAGYKEQLNLHSFYRNQWTGVRGAPKTFSFAVDAIANDGNVGLALQVASDVVGAQNTLSAYANYAYRLRIGQSESSRLAFGVAAGIIQHGIDGAKLNPYDGNDPGIPVGTESVLTPDARAGVYYSDDRFYAGFSVDNLIAQYASSDDFREKGIRRPKMHYYLTAGMLFPLSEDILLKPSFLLKDDRGGPTSLDINSFVLLGNRIWIGASYRTGVSLYSKDYLQANLPKENALVGLVELFATDRLRIGYAYDHNLNKAGNFNNGSHEISIGFFFKRKSSRMLSPRYF
ncbi:PorP/SprF family type IX secretion system membrane protein [Pedobacter hiemivivus]|uniref:Type IX secretion system membrane protein PorP/SprF n=1 Tax=Pedobacter hiemivivus TaxID=2530454 RepID=A0A4R0MMZ9_9SPHI|nr:type IX secretion system membrane protein PorP/SprF [Pedobacter hiemivivus]TCC87867.1 type IX secretion system membrane protein PorP/SprF [Pedobacter hiemivivus]